MNTKRHILILGGARSGKSAYGESIGEAHQGPLTYVATAQAHDNEMKARIDTHVKRRGKRWRTLETPIELSKTLAGSAAPENFIVVDCITLWLTNVMLAGEDAQHAIDTLVGTLQHADGTIVLISNEVGLGIVPENALARRFRDMAGLANQRLASHCDEVVLVAAGLPLMLKPKN
jgi:adenosylcobinamide kinase/adenosylcobinamide-phosphate guanylyltransferase